MKIIICFVLVILASTERCFAEITSSPGLQRLHIGVTCNFRWTVTGTINGLQVSNQTSGSPTSLRQGTNFTYDASNKEIVLTITNVQLWDAGNYSLVINGQTSNAENSACLFVYGTLVATVVVTSGPNPINEGDSVEVTCDVTSNSLPAAYRPNIITSWYISTLGAFPNVSSGPTVLNNGKPATGHSFKNDGRTISIDSVKYPDDSSFICNVLEDAMGAAFYYSQYFKLPIRYRPYVSISSPKSRRFTAVIGTLVCFYFYPEVEQTITSVTNWSFTDTVGTKRNLPLDSFEFYSLTLYSLQFRFTSETYYGKYSMVLANSVGSTIVDFQLLPPGLPDTPSNVQLFYKSHSAISVNWNVMFANSIDPTQTVSVRVISQDTGIEIETQNISFSETVYNDSFNTLLQQNIQPKSNYEVRVWSNNVYGQSGVSSLIVKTRSQPKLNVSPETISINGSQATINFTLVADDLENVTYVSATCCSDLTGLCASSLFQGKTAPSQIVINGITSGTYYSCDLTVNCGVYPMYNYYSARAMGIKVSREGSYQSKNSTSTGPSSNPTYQCSTSFPTTDKETRLSDKESSYFVAVIVLAVLLGVAVLALIGCLVAYLVSKSRSSRHPAHLEQRAKVVPFDHPTKQETAINSNPYSN